MLISDIYHPHPKTIRDDKTVLEAIDELRRDEVNGLIVVNQAGKMVGVMSLQDIAAATVPRQFKANVRMAAAMYRRGFFTEICQQLKDKPVRSIMRKDFMTATLHDNIMTITADFLKNDLYIVPVMEKGQLIGVVTRTEIKQALWDAMTQSTEEELE